MSKPIAISYLRFSTPEQEKGDSLRRQINAAEEWALKNGWELDNTLKFEDRGLSAHSGDHRKKGELGELIVLT